MTRHITTGRLMIYLVLSGFLFRSATLFGGNMQNSVVDLAASIVEFGSFEIDPYHANSPDIAFRDGHYYSGMAPGASLLAVPLYAASKISLSALPESISKRIEARFNQHPHMARQVLTHALMTFVLGFLGGALGLWLVIRIASALTGDRTAALGTGIVYAFGTVMIYYHNSYYTQSIGVLMLLGAFYLLLVLPATPWRLLLGGFLCGFAATVDYPYFFYGGAIAALGAFRTWRSGDRRPILFIGLGMAAPLIGLLAYHWACFGGPLKTPYAFRAHGNLHAGKYLGVGPLHPDRIMALFVSPHEGLLWLMPFVLLLPWNAWAMLRDRRMNADRRLLALAGIGIIGLATLYFVSVPWVSNMAAYGPRFLLAAMPFMAMLAYPCRRALVIPFWILAGYSIAIHQLNMARLNLPLYVDGLMHHQPVQTLSIQLSQISRHFSPLAGILILLALQAALIFTVFALPDVIGERPKQSAAQGVNN